mgnify:CR=1 FL=1
MFGTRSWYSTESVTTEPATTTCSESSPNSAVVPINGSRSGTGSSLGDVVDGAAGDREGVVEFRARYRDAGGPILPGLVTGLGEHLEPGATAVMLGNWEITDEEDGFAHPRAWLEPALADGTLAGARGGLEAGRSGAFWGFWRLMQGLAAEGRALRAELGSRDVSEDDLERLTVRPFRGKSHDPAHRFF